MNQPPSRPVRHFSCTVSVVIPVYNAEAYLPETLESLARQSMPAQDFEILCVDDGSSDESLALCTAFAAKHPNVTVISQPNRGVCAARNAAMDAAKGKYLFFLDSDDTISPDALRDVCRFFDQHENETDLVTYLILYGGTRRHKRSEILTAEGVYCLGTHPQIVQTTMNIIVKNTGLRFEPSLYLGEDQYFIAQNLARLGTIGYVPTAVYNYRRHEGSASRVLNHPALCFDNTVLFFSKLLALAEECPTIQAYLEHLLLYNICWRIKEDRLYSHAKPERDTQRAYFADILTRVDNASILRCPWVKERFKFFLLSLKKQGSVVCTLVDGAVSLVPEKGPVIALPEARLCISRLRLRGSKLDITGSAFSGAVFFGGRLSLCAIVNGKKTDLPLCLCEDSPSNALPEAETQHFFSFTAEISTVQTLEFELLLDGKPVSLSLQFAHLNQIFPKRGRRVHLGGEHSIVLRGKTFFVYKTRSLPVLLARMTRPALLLCLSPLVFLLRCVGNLFFARKTIWLYTDGGREKDAAYLQFQHDLPMQDGVERYYVHAGGQEAAPCSREEAAHTLPPASYRHLLHLLWCEKLVTSSAQTQDILPFSERHVVFQDLLRFESIYIPGKISLLKRTSPLAGMQCPCVDTLVISSRFEEEICTQKLCIGAERLVRTGSPRLDSLEAKGPDTEPATKPDARADEGQNTKPGGKSVVNPESCLAKQPDKGAILYQPEWRTYLFAKNDAAERTAISYFLAGSFFSQIAAFLQDKALAAFLEKEQLRLDIALVPEFAPYKRMFASPCKNVRTILSAERAPLADYSLLITDFSGLLFDFLYAGKAVLSFIPDRAEIDAGLNSNRGFYLPPQKLFTHYTESGATLTPLLETLYASPAARGNSLQAGCAPKDFPGFFLKTPDHRQATYEACMGKHR